MTQDREPEKREVEIESGDYREVQVGDRGIYVEGDYYNVTGQASRERQARLERNTTQQKLLDWVKLEVEGRLKDSLHNRVSITLEKEEDPTKVNPPWVIDVKIGTHKPFRLPSNTTITDIYDRKDIKGRFLILGAPGSGKTTTLLQLAQVLINRAEEDANKPVPVLLNLSSWKDDKQSIKDWIIADLKQKYGVRKDIGQKWVKDVAIIPLLDGLDELAAVRQSLCVEKINQFLQPSTWSNPLVVCSRSEEYHRAATQLGLNGSTILQTLNDQQIKDYTLQTEGEKLWEIVKNDPSLMNLAQTPLLLTIIVISCEKISFYQWQKLDSSPKRLSYLFDAYIEMMLDRKYKGKQPTADKTKHWLGWLAVQLEAENQTEFLIENMQPSWLNSGKERLIFSFLVALIAALMIGVPFFLMFLNLNVLPIKALAITLMIVVPWFLLMFYVGLANYLLIRTVETLSFSLKLIKEIINNLKLSLSKNLINALILGLCGMLMYGLKKGLIDGLTFGLALGLLFFIGSMTFDLINVLISGLHGPAIKFKNYPNQGIKESVKNFVILSIVEATILILIVLAMQSFFVNLLPILANVQLISVDYNLSDIKKVPFLVFGSLCVVSISFMSLPAILHFILRVVLWFSGSIPWNYAYFLDYATNRLFLQRVGGRYRFIHKLLQEHFAKIYVE